MGVSVCVFVFVGGLRCSGKEGWGLVVVWAGWMWKIYLDNGNGVDEHKRK